MKRADWSIERAFRVDEDGCLIWRGPVHSCGAPTIYLGKGNQPMVRRKIMELSLGRPLRADEVVVAKCGKERCCRCLESTTQSKAQRLAVARHDWTKDAVRNARIANTKRDARRWSDAQVDDMRHRHANGERPADIARAYETRSSHLYGILKYRTHVHHLPPMAREAVRAGMLR